MGIVVVFLNGGVCLASFPFVAFKFSICIYSAQEIWVYMWETQGPSHNKRLPFFSEMAHAVCVQVEEVRLLKILGNSPALTVETMSYLFVWLNIYWAFTLCPALCLPVTEETKMHETCSLLSRYLQSNRRDQSSVQTTLPITKKGLFWLKARPLGRMVPWQNSNNNQFEIQLFQASSLLSCISLVFQFKEKYCSWIGTLFIGFICWNNLERDLSINLTSTPVTIHPIHYPLVHRNR